MCVTVTYCTWRGDNIPLWTGKMLGAMEGHSRPKASDLVIGQVCVEAAVQSCLFAFMTVYRRVCGNDKCQSMDDCM